MARVGITFDGENRGALAAARGTSTAIEGVGKSARGLNRDLERTQRQIGQTTRGVLAGSGAFAAFRRTIAFASASFLGSAGLVYALKTAHDAASNLNEQTSKSERVFGSAARSVIAWSKNALGLARDQALETASSIGSLLVPMGLIPREAAKHSVQLTKLGVDLSSFYNTTVQDALDAIKSGLVGETEPLRRYGVILNENRVAAEAMSSGLVKAKVSSEALGEANTRVAIAQARLTKAERDHGVQSVEAAQARLGLAAAERGLEKAMAGTKPQLTDQQKLLARISLILKDTKLAHRDYQRTIGGTANQEREFQKNLRNTEIAIGQGLLPMINQYLQVGNKWLSQEENQQKVADAVERGVHALGEAVKIAVPIIEQAWHVGDNVAKAFGGWERTLKLLLGLKVATWLAGLLGGKGAGLIGANAEAAGLLGSLTRLKTMGPIAIGINLLIQSELEDKTGGVFSWLKDHMLPGELAPLGPSPLIPLGQKALFDLLFGGGGGGKQQPIPFTPGIHGRTLVPPTSVGATAGLNLLQGEHPTSGLSGFPALDIAAMPGTPVGAPEDGRLTKITGHPPSEGSKGAAGVLGYSLYFIGNSGTTYYMTHLAQVAKPGVYRRGQIIAVVAYHPRGSHLHIGFHKGFTSAALGPSTQPPTLGLGAGTTRPTTATTTPTTTTRTPTPPALTFDDATRPDITKLTPALRTRIARAEATSSLVDDRTVYDAVLRLYLQRLKRKGLTADERADLEEAISSVRQKIREINKDIAAAVRAENQKIVDAAKAHPEQWVSAFAGRGAELVPQAARFVNQHIRAAQQALDQALRGARRSMGEGASVLDTLLGFDQNTKVQLQDKFGRTIDTSIGAVVARVRALLNRLEVAMASGNRKAIQAAIDAWKNYAPTVASAVQAGTDAAQQKLEAARTAFETAFGRLSSRILGAFDRETSDHLQAMQRAESDAEDQLRVEYERRADALQARTDARIRRLQARLNRQLAALEAKRQALTPAEQALRELQAGHEAEQAARELADAQRELAEAQQAGDPERIRQALDRLNEIQYQATVQGLQQQAEAERRALDDSVQRQEDSLREKEQAQEEAIQRDLAAQRKALDDELNMRLRVMAEEESAREREYQDERDAQRESLEDELEQWRQALEDKSKTWAEFVSWLQGKTASGIFGKNLPDPVKAMAAAGDAQGKAFADAYIAQLQRAADAQAALTNTPAPNLVDRYAGTLESHGDSGGRRGGFARGGKLGGVYLGREDTIMYWGTPGEHVSSRKLTRAMEEFFFSGQPSGGGTQNHFHQPVFYGTTPRQAKQALADAVTPNIGRRPSYRTVI